MRLITLITLIALLSSLLLASVAHAGPPPKKKAGLLKLQNRGVTYLTISSGASHVGGGSSNSVTLGSASIEIGGASASLIKTGTGVWTTAGSALTIGSALNSGVFLTGQSVAGGLELQGSFAVNNTVTLNVLGTSNDGALRPLVGLSNGVVNPALIKAGTGTLILPSGGNVIPAPTGN
jgi:hypothetical protein